MKYPNYNDYRAMYTKYINRENLLGMLDLVPDYKDKNFMDICAGDGAASREAHLEELNLVWLLNKNHQCLRKIYNKEEMR